MHNDYRMFTQDVLPLPVNPTRHAPHTRDAVDMHDAEFGSHGDEMHKSVPAVEFTAQMNSAIPEQQIS